MGETARVEIATASDSTALSELRQRIGWHASSELLSALLAWDKARILLVRASALEPESPDPTSVIASTSAIAADSVGIIGNVAVHPEFRGRGLARATTSFALQWLRRRSVRSVLLDATRDGQPLYTHLGFLPVARSWYLRVPLSELDRERLAQLAVAAGVEVRHRRTPLPVQSLDRAAFGGDRGELLASMLDSPHNWLAVAGSGDSSKPEPSGYLLYGGLRDSRTSHAHQSIHLGPLVARSAGTAAALLAAALREDAPWRAALGPTVDPNLEIRASIPGVSVDVLAFYHSVGLGLSEDDQIMQFDLNEGSSVGGDGPSQEQRVRPLLAYPGDPRLVYSWLAPMSF